MILITDIKYWQLLEHYPASLYTCTHSTDLSMVDTDSKATIASLQPQVLEKSGKQQRNIVRLTLNTNNQQCGFTFPTLQCYTAMFMSVCATRMALRIICMLSEVVGLDVICLLQEYIWSITDIILILQKGCTLYRKKKQKLFNGILGAGSLTGQIQKKMSYFLCIIIDMRTYVLLSYMEQSSK